MNELIDNCEWKYLNDDGQPGLKIIGPNGNYIFFPFDAYEDGYVRYWLSTPTDDNTKGNYITAFIGSKSTYVAGRNSRYAIRPVSK